MAENKNSFILYGDMIHTVRKMPKGKQADLFMTILRYVNDENPVVEDLIVSLVWEPIKQQLKRDLVKYKGTVDKKSLAGINSAVSKYVAKFIAEPETMNVDIEILYFEQKIKENKGVDPYFEKCLQFLQKFKLNKSTPVESVATQSANSTDNVTDNVTVNGNDIVSSFLWTDECKNFFNDFRWIEKFCRDKNTSAEKLKALMQEFISDLELKGDIKALAELKSHFTNWFNKNNKNGNGKTNRSGYNKGSQLASTTVIKPNKSFNTIL